MSERNTIAASNHAIDLATLVTGLLVAFTKDGRLDADTAICVVAAVIADQYRLLHGDEHLQVLAKIVEDRGRFPLPPMVQ